MRSNLGFQLGTRAARRRIAHDEVLLDGKVREAPASLEDLREAVANEVGRVRVGHDLSAVLDGSPGHVAGFGAEQVRNRLENGGLAGSVRPEEHDNRPLPDLQRQPADRQNGLLVNDFDVRHPENRRRRRHLTAYDCRSGHSRTLPRSVFPICASPLGSLTRNTTISTPKTIFS